MTLQKDNNWFVAETPHIIIIVSIMLKFSLLNYGNPFLFHPDEPYIYKDSFRILYAFSQKDFGVILNPYNFLLSIWYGISFPIGKVFGLWNSFEDFKTQILAENFNIIYIGRIFSFVMSLIASFLLYKYFSKKKNLFNQIIIASIIFFNPIEWISDLWVKFDSFCYLINVVVLIGLIKYKNNKISIVKIALLLGFAFATRMDFISYLIGFLILSKYAILPKLNFKKIFSFLILFSISYLLLTNILLHTVLDKFITQKIAIETEQGFIPVFWNKITQYKFYDILTNIYTNMVYYSFLHIAINLPLIAYDGLILKFKVIRQKEFIFLQFTIWIFLLLFNYNAPHYWLVSQVAYLFFILNNYQEIKMKKKSILISIGLIFYVVSICFQFFGFINFKKDTRIIAAEFVYSNSPPNALIAIEEYQNIGLMPPISECAEHLLDKAKYIQLKKIGTGLTFAAKAKTIINKDCRKIIEIDSKNRFGDDSIAKTYVNTYDIENFFIQKPTMFISKFDCETKQNGKKALFFETVFKKSISKKDIHQYFFDPRLLFFEKENFYPSFFIYTFDQNS